MAELFERYIAVTVGTRRITGLRMAFKIQKNARHEPNTCELSIWNLSASSRAALAQANQPTIIEAGYIDQHEILFSGDLRKAISTRQGPDWVTTLKAGDGERAYRTARISESFAVGTAIKQAAKTVARSLGVSLGDAEAKIDAATHRTGLTQFVKGTVASGPAREAMSSFMTDLGLEWSIQDGALQVIRADEATNETAVYLSPASGLVGSPAAGTDTKNPGVIKITSLLQGGIRPGRKIKLDAGGLAGFYKTEKVTHTGDTHGTPWYSEAEAVPL